MRTKDMGVVEPIFLEPVFKPTLWGGRLLQQEFGYDIPDGPVGECWAISAHPHGDCRVIGGKLGGRTLSELWKSCPELFGNTGGDRFPLLVKVLDAADDLSIQVHPDDAYAVEYEGGSLGKHECWYVLKTKQDAQILVGQRVRSRGEFERLAAQGRWDDLVNRLPVAAGDFFDIKPGTLHAIMAGTMLIEIQQSSDITYRVWDYERPQADGALREIHLAQALDVIDYAAKAPKDGKVESAEVGGVTPLLASEDFCVDRIRVESALSLPQPWPFLCISVVNGSGELVMCGKRYAVKKGTHLIAPYGCGDLQLEDPMELISCHI